MGGINSLWPLFGIANQMLASIALCLATTIILKMQLAPGSEAEGSRAGRPALALITLLPLAWLLTVTMTAGVQKIFHSDPRIGFLAKASDLNLEAPKLEAAFAAARAAGAGPEIVAAGKALHANRVLHFNNLLDAVVAGTFLVLVGTIILLSVREWILLLARRKAALLRESEAVWLPDYAVAEGKQLRVANLLALGLALAKELSGEAQLERAQKAPLVCDCKSARDEDEGADPTQPASNDAKKAYLEMTEQRFNGVRRCC
jgi:carbon starvation protein